VQQAHPEYFTLKILGGKIFARLLERRKEQRHVTVP
jgi:hypothetical protein